MNFQKALDFLKLGHNLRRQSWEKDGATLVLRDRDLWVVDGSIVVKWHMTSAELLADDWETVNVASRSRPPRAAAGPAKQET